MAHISNIKNKKAVTLEKYVGYKSFQMGMRDRAYKLPPQEFSTNRDQIAYESGRLFSAALEGRGENYKKYIWYNKIVPKYKEQLMQIIKNDVTIR